MIELIQISFRYGLLIAIYATVAMFPALFLIAAIGKPRTIALIYLGILFFFTSATTWGVNNPSGLFNIYSRGTGILFFSLLNIYLYGLAIGTAVANGFNRLPSPQYSLRLWFWLFNLMYLAQILVAICNGINIKLALSSHGVINVFNMTALVYVLLHVFRENTDDVTLFDWIVFCVLTRGVWLLFRFTFLGGDPANIYEHAQDIHIRITSFDINDSVLSTVAAYYCGCRLMKEWQSLLPLRRLYFVATVVVGLLVILLSYRRTAWGGLTLASALFIWHQPVRKRVQFGVVGLLVAAPLLLLLVDQRFHQGIHHSFLDQVFPDVFKQGRVDINHSRFTELYYAWLTVKDHWLFGVGSWGRYNAPYWLSALSFHGGDFDYVHSGFGHVFLKTGAIGLLIFCAIFVAYFQFIKRTRSRLSTVRSIIVDASAAGMLFSAPNLLGGTPIIEYRTTQLLGLLLAIPFLAHNIDQRNVPSAVISPVCRE